MTIGMLLPVHYCFHRKPPNAFRIRLSVLFTVCLVIFVALNYRLQIVSSRFHLAFSTPRQPTQGIQDGFYLVQFPYIEDGLIYHSFAPNRPEDAIADHKIRPIHSHTQISDECLEQWVGKGRWEGSCTTQNVADAIIDLVYVWVNGSNPLHEKERAKYLEATGGKPKNSRFREHDELRFSLRASTKATESWNKSVWHIITADVPHPRDPERRLGLVPQWLDFNATIARSEDNHSSIYLHHDSQLFRLINTTDAPLTPEAAVDWRDSVLPTFNSHSIESQLPNLDPHLVSENIISLNDDQFLALPAPPSAFHSTLYGPVLRLDRNIQVSGDTTARANGEGEWRSLGWSAHLLNTRFGERTRAYVAHNARSLSLPLMHETSLAFGAQFSATPLSRFRGSHRDLNELEVNMVFLATHWVIERKREALLWSWIVAKWGARNGGRLDEETRMAMWEETGGHEENNEIIWKNTRRTTATDVDVQMRLAGLKPPTVADRNVQAHTDYTFVSQDGYPTDLNRRTTEPTLALSRACLGTEEGSAWDLFIDVLKHKPGCGDSIIAALVRPDNGLSLFLPPTSTVVDQSDPITLPSNFPRKHHLSQPTLAPSLSASCKDIPSRSVQHRHASSG
ncbi:hypothetical protein BDZ89DRAFT_343800 [Hymenopellis radicata]|nr:hypothetical protein BDZ89DRAFT_343800 [Hymenopellis radicata]